MHGTVIMCQGMAFSVAMNSKRSSALVALLIASNFVEIKGAKGCTFRPYCIQVLGSHCELLCVVMLQAWPKLWSIVDRTLLVLLAAAESCVTCPCNLQTLAHDVLLARLSDLG